MKRIIAIILASVMMLFALVSCDNNKEKGKNQGQKIDLASFVVAKTEHFEIDGAMYAYFLYDFVVQEYQSLIWYGYDNSLPMSEQTSKCPFGENKTWLEFISETVNSQIDQYLSACEAAVASDYSLTEDQIAEIKNYIAELNTDAVENGYKDFGEVLKEYYAEGVTLEVFEKCLYIQQLSYSYMNDHSLEIEITDEDLVKYRIEHPEKFLMIDVIQYGFFAEYDSDATDEEIEAAEADAKARAEAFIDNNKTVDAFKNAIVALESKGENSTESPGVIISNYLLDAELYDAESAATDTHKSYYEWAYSTDREVGDTFLLEEQYSDGEKYYTVFCIVTPAYYYDYLTKDCRHILFYVNNEETDADKLASAKTEALGKANAILDEFKNGNKTEDDFKALEKKCLDDESALEATAYYNVTKGYMVEEFENWIYGERKTGDCEIVETIYGFHVVYFIGDGIPVWKIEARSGYISETMTEYQQAIIETYKVTYDSDAIKKIP